MNDRLDAMWQEFFDLCRASLAGLCETLQRLQPHVIVNVAAHTAVDKAESGPELARFINVTVPGVLAQKAQKLSAWLVHYSTDYVFKGSGSQPWTETDTPAPLSVYGSCCINRCATVRRVAT